LPLFTLWLINALLLYFHVGTSPVVGQLILAVLPLVAANLNFNSIPLGISMPIPNLLLKVLENNPNERQEYEGL